MNRSQPATPSACAQLFNASAAFGECESLDATVAALSATLDAFDRYTAEHSCQTSELAEQVAARLGLSRVEIEHVRLVAALHDLGKIGIPSHILRKPAPLTDDEVEVIRQHPLIGERILRTVPALSAIAHAIRHEHERWDGSGYPDGLAGEEIPLASRIVLVCDAYEAMTSDRPYRSALSEREARRRLRDCAGGQFDPQVAEALLRLLSERVSAAA